MRKTLLSAALIFVAAPALAGDTGSKEEQAACKGDVRKLCSAVTNADNDKYKQCLQAHFQQLSQKCQEVLMKHQRPK